MYTLATDSCDSIYCSKDEHAVDAVTAIKSLNDSYENLLRNSYGKLELSKPYDADLTEDEMKAHELIMNAGEQVRLLAAHSNKPSEEDWKEAAERLKAAIAKGGKLDAREARNEIQDLFQYESHSYFRALLKGGVVFGDRKDFSSMVVPATKRSGELSMFMIGWLAKVFPVSLIENVKKHATEIPMKVDYKNMLLRDAENTETLTLYIKGEEDGIIAHELCHLMELTSPHISNAERVFLKMEEETFDPPAGKCAHRLCSRKINSYGVFITGMETAFFGADNRDMVGRTAEGIEKSPRHTDFALGLLALNLINE